VREGLFATKATKDTMDRVIGCRVQIGSFHEIPLIPANAGTWIIIHQTINEDLYLSWFTHPLAVNFDLGPDIHRMSGFLNQPSGSKQSLPAPAARSKRNLRFFVSFVVKFSRLGPNLSRFYFFGGNG